MPKRPNVLFLMSDEHRADVAGFAGNTIVRTPTLDALARTGVVFRNAYTPSPICIPGRQAITSGQFPRHCQCERFGEDIPPNSMTFARRFAQYAYQAVCCGKLHHCGVDQMQGWTHRYGADTHVSPHFIAGRDEASYRAVNPNPFRRKRTDAMELIKAGVGRGKFTQDADRYALAGVLMHIEHHFIDSYYDRMTPDEPLLLNVSFNRPHFPYLTSEEKLHYYLNRVQPFLDEPVFDHPFLGSRVIRPGVDVSERDIRKATAAYYGMIEEVDTDYQRVLDALAAAGQNLDDWIIVYTTDHGEMLGEHGVWEKQKFFEGSARVPLIIRWPRAFGPRVVDENVNLCDLFATLCDLCELPLPRPEETIGGRGLDSRSLAPLLRNEPLAATEWRQRHLDETVSQFGGRNLMIKRGSIKYQSYGPDEPEVLFDLAVDPTERRNLVAEARYAPLLPDFRRRRDELGFAP